MPCSRAAQHECVRQIISVSLEIWEFLLAFKVSFCLCFFFFLTTLYQRSLSLSLSGWYHTVDPNKHLGHLTHTIHILYNTHIFWSTEHCNSSLFTLHSISNSELQVLKATWGPHKTTLLHFTTSVLILKVSLETTKSDNLSCKENVVIVNVILFPWGRRGICSKGSVLSWRKIL